MSNITLQPRSRSLQRQHEASSHNIRSCRRRVRMVIGVIRIHNRGAQVLEQVRRVKPVVDEDAPGGCGGVAAVAGEAARGVDECARLPGVVRCRRGDDDVGALRGEELGGVDEVGLICEDGLCDPATNKL